MGGHRGVPDLGGQVYIARGGGRDPSDHVVPELSDEQLSRFRSPTPDVSGGEQTTSLSPAQVLLPYDRLHMLLATSKRS